MFQADIQLNSLTGHTAVNKFQYKCYNVSFKENFNQIMDPGQGVKPARTSHQRVGTANAVAMSRRGHEVVKMVTRSKVDICWFQETCLPWGSPHKIKKKVFIRFFGAVVHQVWNDACWKVN